MWDRRPAFRRADSSVGSPACLPCSLRRRAGARIRPRAEGEGGGARPSTLPAAARSRLAPGHGPKRYLRSERKGGVPCGGGCFPKQYDNKGFAAPSGRAIPRLPSPEAPLNKPVQERSALLRLSSENPQGKPHQSTSTTRGLDRVRLPTASSPSPRAPNGLPTDYGVPAPPATSGADGDPLDLPRGVARSHGFPPFCGQTPGSRSALFKRRDEKRGRDRLNLR